MKQSNKQKINSPTSGESGNRSSKSDIIRNDPTLLFYSMVADMTWRLFLSVLLPIILGAELDKHLKTRPFLTIAGFLVGLSDFILVVRYSFAKAGSINSSTKPSTRKQHA